MSRREHDLSPASEGAPDALAALTPPADVLRALAAEKVKGFCALVRDDGSYVDPVYLSVKRTATQIGEDYGSRFVLELVQNAYDAHPPGTRDGVARVLLDPSEGAHGVLYVANGGQPFLRHNVEALCNVGLSDKKIGQTIGNKGLGFRSVRLVSDDPQVFSRSAPGGTGPFDGFCFRFARAADFDELVTETVSRTKIKEDSPPFWAPIPLSAEPPHVAALAREGFATVVRIPLRSDKALDATRAEVARLRDDEAPLLLFLQRLRALEVRVVGDSGFSLTLCRSAETLMSAEEGEVLERVDLGLDGRYLVIWRRVPEAEVLAQIRQSVEENRLDAEWLGWEGEGEVALAVRLDEALEAGRSYTFLPMREEAEAPFPGHLHASFFAKVDRRALDFEVPLNAFYLEEALDLAAVAAKTLCEAPTPALEEPEHRAAVADLLSWHDVSRCPGMAAALVGAFEEQGTPLLEYPVVPVLPRPETSGWARPDEAWVWDRSDVTCITAERLAEVGAAVLDPALGPTRIARLEAALEAWGCETRPSDRALAEHVERIAQALPRTKKASPPRWRAFYQDLPVLFGKRQKVLAGREVLLGEDGALLRALTGDEPTAEIPSRRGRRGRIRTVFFPPQRALGEANITVPKRLRQGVAFLENLGWGEDLRDARGFLESGKLVAPYDADNLVAQVSRTVQSSTSAAVRSQGLRWVFNLWATSRRTLSLQRARLLVPTLSGRWVDAEDAVFSEGWPPHTQGDTLTQFLSLAASHDEELAELADRLLAPPGEDPFSGDAEEWASFLEKIGVRSGLRLRSALPTPQTRVEGAEVNVESLARRFGLGPVTTALWEAEAEVTGERSWKYPQTEHVIEGTLHVLPGQESHQQWPAEARLLFAQLLLRLLSSRSPSAYRVAFKHYRYAHSVHLPTPFAAFLRQAAWFPVQPAGEQDAPVEFVPPSQTWLASDEERLPHYLPRPHLQVRRVLNAEDGLVERLAFGARINVWGTDASAPRRAADLARFLAAGTVTPFHHRSLVNDYEKAWATLSDLDVEPDWAGQSRYLIVRRGDTFEAVSVADGGGAESVYVQDTPDDLVPSLLRALDKAVFAVVLSSKGEPIQCLQRILGDRYRATSAVALEVAADGVPLPEVRARRLVDEAPALPALVLLAAASLKGTLASALPADRQRVIKAFCGIGLATARHLDIQVEGASVPIPQVLRGALGVTLEGEGVVVLEGEETLSWDGLHRAAAPACKLAHYGALEQPLKLAIRALERAEAAVERPLEERARRAVAEELGLDDVAATAALLPLQGDPAVMAPMLRLLAHYFAGADGVSAVDALGGAPVEDVVAVVAARADAGVSMHDLLRACREAATYRDLRVALDLDLGRMNRSLAALGERPVMNQERHAQALRAFVDRHRDAILDRLRQPYVGAFEGGDSLDAYVAAREGLGRIEPDAAWATTVWEPDEPLLRACVDAWLSEHEAPPLSAPPSGLPAPSEVRRTNFQAAQELASEARRIVTAWCAKHAVAPAPPWEDARGAPAEVTARLDGRGLFDFDMLSPERLLNVVAAVAGWPDGMPITLDSAALDLSAADLDAEARRHRREQEERDRERRSVRFGDDVIDPEVDDRRLNRRVSDRLAAAVAEGTVPTALDDVSTLEPLGGGGKKPGTPTERRKGGGHRKIDARAAEIVGFLGECAVYHWLRGCYPDLAIDQAWKSEYRARLLPGSGHDSLGYDFEIHLPHQTVFLEVKAHLDDPGEIILGETEVRKARDCASEDAEAYRVVYVSNVGDPKRLRIDVLPNPLEARIDGIYRMAGEGLRFRFHRR